MMPFVESVYQFYVKYCSMVSIYVTCTTFLESAVLHSAGTQTAAILLAYCKTRGDGRDLMNTADYRSGCIRWKTMYKIQQCSLL